MNKMSFTLLMILLVLLVSCTTEPDDDDDGWDAAKVCPDTGTNSYGMPNRGTFTDERDGQVYKYTTIGDQVWMAENLKFDCEYSYCYYEDDDCQSLGRTYYPGYLTVCPKGWHLPSDAEWQRLFNLFESNLRASKILKATYSWTELNPGEDPNGTDECGFSAIYAKSQIDESGFESGFLSSTNTSSINNNVRIYTFLSYGDGIGSSTQPSYYHSQYARCIKD